MATNGLPNLSFTNTPVSQFASTAPTPTQNLFQQQQIFMQPIGNIYGLNNSTEVGNIPIGAGVSVGLCLSEGIMYLKSMQNSGPVLLAYKLNPLEAQAQTQVQQKTKDDSSKLEELLKKYDAKISELEQRLASPAQKGGKSEWQL